MESLIVEALTSLVWEGSCLSCFQFAGEMQVISAVSDGKMPEIHGNIPENIRTTISQCWDDDPAKRASLEQIESTLKESVLILTTENCGCRTFG